MKFSYESRNKYLRGPTQLVTPLYSQLILRICAAANRLGGGSGGSKGGGWMGHAPPDSWLGPACPQSFVLNFTLKFV